MIGMGTVARGYPLYYDAINEHGLYVAGLNYVGNAKYLPPKQDKVNLAPFELIPYILSKCTSVSEAKKALSRISITDIPFSRELPCAELHWMIADKERAIVAEPDENGINIYDNPVYVLTNNPPFPYQLLNLSNYLALSPSAPENRIMPETNLKLYSEGMGAIGLPGDLSSTSRFVRATFHRAHARGKNDVSTLFHLLTSVGMPNGSVNVGEAYERTEYTTVTDLSTLTYYYLAYDASAIHSVSLLAENIDTPSLIRYPIVTVFSPKSQN